LGVAFLLVPVPRFSDPLGTAILDADGHLLGARTASDGQWRFGRPEKLPEKYRRALIEYEDHRFYLHPGVDPLAIFRALLQDIRAGKIVSGGSTITMQVVRLSHSPRPRSLLVKLLESFLALRLEATTSKDEILRMYAGHAPFGGNTVGVRAASWRLFERPLDDLSWAEAATLAVLPNAPSLIRPDRHPELLLGKRNTLLRRLAERGALSPMDLELALAEALPEKPRPLRHLAPHLLERIRREHPSGGVFITTLESRIQRKALEIGTRHHRRLEENGIDSLAVIIADTRSGRVLAYLGNVGNSEGSQVDILMAPRSSGSILKPFLFAAMLQNGEILPDQLVADIPTRIAGFAPRNFDYRFSGAIPASVALSRSLNVPAVRMLRSHGIGRFASLLRKLGLSTLFRPADDYGLSLILGGAEVRLWEMTGLYRGLGASLLQAGHQETSASFSLSFLKGEQLSGSASPFDPGVLWTTLEALKEVSRPDMEAGWRSFSSARDVSWKTGTSYGFRDAWAIGVTPAYTVGVWAGNADGEGRPGLIGHSAAAPVLFELFDSLPAWPSFEAPEWDLREVTLCAESGYLAGRDCAHTRKASLPLACLPGRICPYCRLIHLGPKGRFRVDSSCEEISRIRSQSFFILPPALAGEYQKRHPEYRPLPPWRNDCVPQESTERLSCSYPEEGSQIYIPLELDGARGRMVAEAADSDPSARIDWHLDGHYLGRTRGEHRMAILCEAGPHRLTLIDDAGARVSVSFTILSRNAQGP